MLGLGQSILGVSGAQSAAFGGLFWLGICVLAVFLGAVVLFFVRRMFFTSHEGDEATFSLERLRQMRNQAQISEQEYKSLRNQVIKRLDMDN